MYRGACGEIRPLLTWRDFSGGTRHITARCPRCGGFLGWVPQTPENIESNRACSNYAGWLKENNGEWRLVCCDDDLDTCWWLLLRIPSIASFAERVVTRGQHPDQRRKPR